MQLDKRLYEEIGEYCKLNGLKTRDFIHKILKEAFLKEKYGETPFFIKNNNIENEKVVEENATIEDTKPEPLEIVIEKTEIINENAEVNSETTENNIETEEKEIIQIEKEIISTPKLRGKRKLK